MKRKTGLKNMNMEEPVNYNNKNTFLKEKGHTSVTKHHVEYLGTTIPESYFTQSKLSILDKINEDSTFEKKPKKQLLLYLKPYLKQGIAAAIIVLFSVTIWLQNSNNSNTTINSNLEEITYSDAILINSLLVDDTELDAFTDAALYNEVVIKAELSIQKVDNLIINSLIVEDSLLDNYIDDNLIETLIL